MQNLAIETLVNLLGSNERELLRASVLFEIPVPIGIFGELTARLGLSGRDDVGQPLIDLGLWELHRIAEMEHAALPALVRPHAGSLTEEEMRALAGEASGPLFEHWGGSGGRAHRSFAADHELARLALAAEDTDVLAATAADAVSGLEVRFLYREAAKLGRKAVAVLDDASVPVPLALLRSTGDMCSRTGNTEAAASLLQRAVAGWESAEDVDAQQYAWTLRLVADLLRQSGDVTAALAALEKAKDLLTGDELLRSRAITMGKIADIYQARGELDEALRIRQEEELPVYDKLGDVHSRAITMGQIADIYQARGELDEALRIRQEEELPVYDKLGDRDSRAAVLWKIAKADLARQDYQSALERLTESYSTFLHIGRLDGICFVGMSLGQLLFAAGQQEQAREILDRSRAGFEKLGRTDMALQVDQLLIQLSEAAEAEVSPEPPEKERPE